MSKVPLTEVIHKLVDKWSFELLHKSKLGDTQAMVQTAQIQFSHRGWGRITPNPTQARLWLQHAASRGDTVAHNSLQNLRTMIAAHQHDLAVAKEYGLIDLNKKGPDGKPISPTQQLGLPPMSFSRIVTHNVTNNLEATSEEAAVADLLKQYKYQSMAELLAAHRQKLISQGKPLPKVEIPAPIDYRGTTKPPKQAPTPLTSRELQDLNINLKQPALADTIPEKRSQSSGVFGQFAERAAKVVKKPTSQPELDNIYAPKKTGPTPKLR